MSQKLSLRQTRLRTQLPMIGNSVDERGDSVLSKVDAELAKLFEDRNALLTDGGLITFTGTQLQFTESLKLTLNSKIDGSVQVFDLGSTSRDFSASGRMLYAVLDRSLGTASVVSDATALPSVVAANQEVFLIAKRIDAGDATQRVYFREGSALNAGQTSRIGSSGSNSEAITPLQESFKYGFQPFVDTSNLMTATTATGTPAAGTFHSTVVNRSPMIDLRKDLGTRMGIQRIPIHNIELVPGEYGSSGQAVYRLTNDKWNSVRVVGNWDSNALNLNLASGPYISTGDTTAFVEITFYGTGLNILTTRNDANRQIVRSVDGGAESGSLLPGASASSVIGAVSYNANSVSKVAEDLALGVHTVRIRNTNTVFICGFEIINESTDLKTVPGTAYIEGKKYSVATLNSTAYNTPFESGTLGTKGGRVVAYLKPDNSIAKAVNPVDATALFTTNTNHSNEEVLRTYWVREFGTGRLDDFQGSSTAPSGDRVFTIDDGVTTLGSNSTVLQPVGAVAIREGVFSNILNGVVEFTFIGTGIDVMSVNTNTVGSTYSIVIDGLTVATGLTGAALRSNGAMYPIASGLPYGTHKVRIVGTNLAGNAWIIGAFTVYGTKAPAINASYIPLAEYYIPANFVNTVVGSAFTSDGVVRKVAAREMVYVNGTGGTQDWAQSSLSVVNGVAGHVFATDRANAYFETTFAGTGLDYRFNVFPTGSTSITLSINGTTLTTANFPSATFGVYGTGVAFNAATGVLDQADASTQRGAGFYVTGLPYGQYTFKANNNNAGQFLSIEAVDIVTPFHVPNKISPVSNQALNTIGQTSVTDLRNITPVKEAMKTQKPVVQAYGVGPDITTTSTIPIPANQMHANIVTSGGPIEIEFVMHISNNTLGAATLAVVYVDGKQEGELSIVTQPVVNYVFPITNSIIVPVAPGGHNVTVMWYVSAGTATLNSDRRSLTVKEL